VKGELPRSGLAEDGAGATAAGSVEIRELSYRGALERVRLVREPRATPLTFARCVNSFILTGRAPRPLILALAVACLEKEDRDERRGAC